MVNVKPFLAAIMVILVAIIGLLISEIITWTIRYFSNKSDIESSLYDSTSTEEELKAYMSEHVFIKKRLKTCALLIAFFIICLIIAWQIVKTF